jgi:hypothetical protein
MSDLSTYLITLIKKSGYKTQKAFAEKLNLNYGKLRKGISEGIIPDSHLDAFCNLLSTSREELESKGLKISSSRSTSEFRQNIPQVIHQTIIDLGIELSVDEFQDLCSLYFVIKRNTKPVKSQYFTILEKAFSSETQS